VLSHAYGFMHAIKAPSGALPSDVKVAVETAQIMNRFINVPT
jgi:hypothetical protein